MATVVNTLIEGLTDKMVQAKVNQIDAKGFYFGRLFPVRKSKGGFKWSTIENQRKSKNVAGDITADNATVIRKKRPIFQSANGDLPRITISRDWKRSEIKDYQTALALAGDPMAAELVSYWADDVDFCFNGVQSTLEYIALALASNAGVLSFTGANNAAVVTEFDLDYQVEDNQLMTVSTSFGNAASADILKTFADAVKRGKDINSNIKYVKTSLDNFYRIASSEQIIKQCASYLQNLTDTSQTPDLETVNAMLRKQAWLNGVQIEVIDQTITHELADGSEISGNPFADHRLVFSETPTLGHTEYDILKDNDPNVIRVERTHTVIKRYGTVEPKTEVTIGETDAISVLDSAYSNIYVKTDGNDW